ncbi:hypothetical protein B0I35DRAFT_426583 [Stachybotrys elegans]|uniref:Uncharacterized protein n=1 Tax=Stachybotrys elegans TaxID=80388 RepID=A0A8K0SVQ1_9HYPO|nr:hypothetical protein B0I35DRAFT_426583 [Stachybotrys elegans]
MCRPVCPIPSRPRIPSVARRPSSVSTLRRLYGTYLGVCMDRDQLTSSILPIQPAQSCRCCLMFPSLRTVHAMVMSCLRDSSVLHPHVCSP